MAAKPAKPNAEPKGSNVSLYVFTVGIWVAFVWYGKVLEQIKSKKGFGPDGERFVYTDFIIAAQSVVNATVAALALLMTQSGGIVAKLTANVSPKDWGIISVTYFGASALGLGALAYISYPLQVLLKSCKPIPVMLGEKVVANKMHPPEKTIGVFVLVAGISVFMTGSSSSKGAGEPLFEATWSYAYGCAMILGALCCDGYYGPAQMAIKQKNDKAREQDSNTPALTGFHNMLAMNLIQLVITSVSMFLFSDVPAAFTMCNKYPVIRSLIIELGVSMAIGAACIYKLQDAHGSLMVTTVTTIRKLISIVFSVIFFGHSITQIQVVGVVIVVFEKYIARTMVATLRKMELVQSEEAFKASVKAAEAAREKKAE